MFRIAEADLKKSGVHANGGLKVMEHILQHGSIPRQDYYLMVGDELGKQLLDLNVLSCSPSSSEVTFHSKLVENYMRMEDAKRKINKPEEMSHKYVQRA